jgi:hypothetical protein
VEESGKKKIESLKDFLDMSFASTDGIHPLLHLLSPNNFSAVDVEFIMNFFPLQSCSLSSSPLPLLHNSSVNDSSFQRLA